MTTLSLQTIEQYQQALNNHPLLVGDVLQTIDDVRTFMGYHVYAVWDFMSLIKSLQHHVVPSTSVWVPASENTAVGRLINEVVLGEETDIGPFGGHMSHFDLYVGAMAEIGADTDPINEFVQQLRTNKKLSLNQMLLSLPTPARNFCNSTFEFIATGKPHVIAAAFAFGRERVIPGMFTSVVQQMEARGLTAPQFKFYLDRHIHLDGEEHGPASIQMVEALCGGDPEKITEAETAALDAITERVKFWTAVQRVIEQVRAVKQNGVTA